MPGWLEDHAAVGGRLYVIADDGGDPARNQAQTRRLVEQDGVLAFVGNNAPLVGAGATQRYLEEKRVPAIGNEGGENYYHSPMHFPQMPVDNGLIGTHVGATATVARTRNFTKAAILHCVEVQTCTRYSELGPRYAERFGLTIVSVGEASIVAPDYTSHCQAAKSAGAEIFIVALDVSSFHRLGRSCNAINYRPLITNIAQATGEMAKDPNLEGIVVAMPVLPWMVTTNPAIIEYQTVLTKYAPALPFDPGTITGWVAAKLFEAASVNLPETPTSEGILKGLWSIKNNDLGGLTYPITFSEGQNAPEVLCYFVAQLKGGEWFSPNGGARECASEWPY